MDSAVEDVGCIVRTKRGIFTQKTIRLRAFFPLTTRLACHKFRSPRSPEAFHGFGSPKSYRICTVGGGASSCSRNAPMVLTGSMQTKFSQT